jgi:hypothetical protein
MHRFGVACSVPLSQQRKQKNKLRILDMTSMLAWFWLGVTRAAVDAASAAAWCRLMSRQLCRRTNSS